jgi:hypothetical protein
MLLAEMSAGKQRQENDPWHEGRQREQNSFSSMSSTKTALGGPIAKFRAKSLVALTVMLLCAL